MIPKDIVQLIADFGFACACEAEGTQLARDESNRVETELYAAISSLVSERDDALRDLADARKREAGARDALVKTSKIEIPPVGMSTT